MKSLYYLIITNYALEAAATTWAPEKLVSNFFLYLIAGATFLTLETILLVILYYRHEFHQHGVDSQYY